MNSQDLYVAISSALVRHSWCPEPERTYRQGESVSWRFVRPLPDGWVAMLHVEWCSREAIEVSKWRRGTREVVFANAGVTYPPGDDVAHAVGMRFPAGVDLPVDVTFGVVGQEPGELQMRGPEDYDRAVQLIDQYASRTVPEWAGKHATLGSWIAEHEQPENTERSAWATPVMLAAHGRNEDARARLAVARASPELAANPEFIAFAERLESFLETGVLPDPPPPQNDPPEQAWTPEDPIRQEFLEGFLRERAEEPVSAQLRFAGRKLRSWLKTMREIGNDEANGSPCWAPVALASDAEQLLDRAFEAAGPPVDHRVGLQVDLGGSDSAPDDGVEVRFGGTAVGVLQAADIPPWGVVPQRDEMRRARLTRKRDAPRFLLEVDIGS